MTLFHSAPVPRQDGIVCCPVRAEPYIKSIIYSAIRHSAAEVLPTFVIRPALRKLWSK